MGNPVSAKTLGGLPRAYYFRQFVFGMVVCAVILALASELDDERRAAIPSSTLAVFAVCTVLYPYACFVHESVVGFVMGINNLFTRNFVYFVMEGKGWRLFKIFGILLCFLAAPGMAMAVAALAA